MLCQVSFWLFQGSNEKGDEILEACQFLSFLLD